MSFYLSIFELLLIKITAMKKLHKKMIFGVCSGLLILGGTCLIYQKVQISKVSMSELTLANLEALADYDFDNELNVYKVKCRGEGTRPCPEGGTAAVVKYKDK